MLPSGRQGETFSPGGQRVIFPTGEQGEMFSNGKTFLLELQGGTLPPSGWGVTSAGGRQGVVSLL